MKKWLLSFLMMAWIQTVGHASVLSDAAAALQPGQWTTIATTGINATFLSGPSTGRINPYAESLIWDSTGRKIYFNGCDHGATPGRLAIYDEATNSWSWTTMPAWGNHGYDHIAINATAHEIYFRHYGNGTVSRYSTTSASFLSDLPAFPSPWQVAGGLSYFPERNELFFVDGDWGAKKYSFSTATWTTISSGNGDSWSPHTPMGAYHNLAEYNSVKKLIVFGGGGSSRKLYQYNTAGVISNLPDAPISIGIQGSIFTVDPVSGDYLVFSTTGNSFYKYNVTNGAWTIQPTAPIFTGSINSPAVDGVVGGPIGTYGVVAFVDCTNSNCDLRLYKHDGPPPVPDTLPPSAPSNVRIATLTLSWAPSTDNVAVSGYRIFDNGQQIGTSSTALFAANVVPGAHDFEVYAFDAAGNVSGPGSYVIVVP